jgi:adenylate kinase family enzyme
LRILVIGTSGAGKTTLARRIAAGLGLLHIELDAINWQPGWRDLDRHDPEEFARRVAVAIQTERWVADGNYGSVRDPLWRRATHLVWLDYDRPIIMTRVIVRSVHRAVSRTELWAGTGNREAWRDWMRASHPIRWAWSTWSQRRRETEEQIRLPAYAHLSVYRLRQPRQTNRLLSELAAVAAREP